jgi:arabinofuranosyltransferase
VPCGALVVVALPPFWDFGTSGMETGLVVGWLGLAWWLLVRRLGVVRAVPDGPGAGRAWPVALVFGLAPLVRPDLAVFGLVAAVALAVVEHRRGWRRLAGLAGVAAAVPVAYEVFRAGYYGLLVPGTALAKEAGVARWQEGVWYLDDLVGTYRLGYPLVLVAAALLVLAWRFRRAATPVVVVVTAAPLVAGLVMGLYVVGVGGDFMHARMLLPALFAVLLPVAAVPLSRWTALPVLGVAVWALVCLVAFRPAYQATLGPHGIANERMYYVDIVARPHPVVTADFVDHPVAPQGVAELAAAPVPTLAIPGPGPNRTLRWWLLPATSGPSTITWLNIGVTGALAPLSTRVLDPVGLANPLAAHTLDIPDGRIGHDKYLPPDWYAADQGTSALGYLDPRKVAAARVALTCPTTADLLASYRAPLTWDRFWANLLGAPARTAYRYAADPRVAAGC